MTKQRAMNIIRGLIDDDLECMDPGDVVDKMFSFMDEQEIRELGYAYLLDGEDE